MISTGKAYLSGSGLGPTLLKALTGSAGLRVLGMMLGFLVGVQLARGLGAEGYGVYGLAMSIVTLLGVPIQFGLPQLLTREVAAADVRQDWSLLRGILLWARRAVLLTSLSVATAALGWLLLSGQWRDSQLAVTVCAGLLLVPLSANGSIRSAALRGLRHIVKGQLPDTVVKPGLHSLLLLLLPLLWIPLTPFVAMALGALAALFALVVASAMLRKALPREVDLVQPRIESRKWWKDALPMAATEGMRLLQAHVVILILGMTTTTTDVGIYRVAASVVTAIGVPVSLINIVCSPLIARLYAQHEEFRLRKLLGWMSMGMTVGVTLLSLPFLFGGGWLLGHVFGDQFSASSPILLVLCAGFALSSLFGGNAALLNMVGGQGYVTRGSAISLVVLVVLCVLLTNVLGVMGAAVANSVALVVWNVVMWRYAVLKMSFGSSVFTFKR